MSKRYYWEDYVRVYPDDLVYGTFGRTRRATPNERNNFLNHVKFYKFSAQFVDGKVVADIGCGSGYGAEVLKRAGALAVHGSDISKHAIRFAKARFGDICEFSLQEITNLRGFGDEMFDVSISSEVLEHIKEFKREGAAIAEMKRITKTAGLIIIGTPNSEVTGGHGFSYDELIGLLKDSFSKYCVFENALLPFGQDRSAWQKRYDEGRTGLIISENIDLGETMRISNEEHEIKQGIPSGVLRFENYDIDTRLLHNTHSWVGLAISER